MTGDAPETSGEQPQPPREGYRGNLIMRGMTPRIPAGGLRMRITDTGVEVEHVKFEASLSMWPVWLEIAINNYRAAHAAHKRLLEAHQADDHDAVVKALSEEFAASLQAVTAAAFSVDALYAELATHIELPQAVHDQWQRSRTSRAGRIADVFHRAAALPNEKMKALRHNLGAIFRLRNDAVHPPSRFSDFVLYAEIERGVARQYVEYTAVVAHGAVNGALNALNEVFENPRRSIEQWTAPQRTILENVLKDTGVKVTRKAEEPLRDSATGTRENPDPQV